MPAMREDMRVAVIYSRRSHNHGLSAEADIFRYPNAVVSSRQTPVYLLSLGSECPYHLAQQPLLVDHERRLVV